MALLCILRLCLDRTKSAEEEDTYLREQERGQTLPQATINDPHTAGVGCAPAAAICGSTLNARSTSPEYEAALMYVLYVNPSPCTANTAHHQHHSDP